MTRFLIQKPAAYAELAENSRIALSVLGDEGWQIDRVEMDMRVRVSTTTTIQQMEERDALAAELQTAQARFILLRAQVIENAADQWLALAIGCLGCAALEWFGLGHWCWALALACAALWGIVKRWNRTKASA